MNRRQFVSRLAALPATTALLPAAPNTPVPPDPSVKRVLAMFKCHLDVGFVDTQAAVINRYFTVHYPRAIEIANTLRQYPDIPANPTRYVWTTGSWLLWQYLEQASPTDRKRMEQAIARGDIAWHALPFTWQTELLNRSFITGALGFSQSLDRRFGRKTTGAKMTDVPGHSRGLIAPLAAAGVTFLDIGVNSASTPPDVPPLFLWKDPSGASLLMMYHRLEYGGVIRIPNSDLAIAVEVADDNLGPHPPEEIRAIWNELRRRFPQARIQAASLTGIAHAVEPYRNSLPVLTKEIGDTWIYGVSSDPVKLARFRETLRLRDTWIANHRLRPGDPADLAFLGKFALAAEHTWGTDTKTWLDFNHYTPAALAQVLSDPKYKTVTGSWVEKLADIDAGIAALPPDLRSEAMTRLAALQPRVPEAARLRPGTSFESPRFAVTLDPATGVLTGLRNKATGREWASAAHPLAAFSYQTLSKADYDRFLAAYITVQTDWAPKDFGKPNIQSFGAQSRLWTTRLLSCVHGEEPGQHRCVARLAIQDSAAQADGLTAWPAELYLELVLPNDEPVVHLNFTWRGKRANRLPEAMWLSFHPDAPRPDNWLLSKVEAEVKPSEVVSGGNRRMHGLWKGLRYQDEKGLFELETLDSPLIVFGDRTPLAFSRVQPDPAAGFHISLFNNGWGTNYVQWFGEDMCSRFTLRL